VEDGVQRLWVTDTGKGMADHIAPGTGLTNLRARMATFFGPASTIEFCETLPHGLHAELRWSTTQ
jgi:hypothetical protein